MEKRRSRAAAAAVDQLACECGTRARGSDQCAISRSGGRRRPLAPNGGGRALDAGPTAPRHSSSHPTGNGLSNQGFNLSTERHPFRFIGCFVARESKGLGC
jgi:hypothetical protein